MPSSPVKVWFLRDWTLIEFCISFFMIKYSKFTDNIGSGNFTDIFCQNSEKLQESWGSLTPPTAPALHALVHGHNNWVWSPHFLMQSKFKFDKISSIHWQFCMKVIGDKLETLKLKYTITIICQTGFILSSLKIMRSHDLIIFSFCPNEQKCL